MKKMISILAALSLTIYASGFSAASADEINVTVNGQPVIFDVAPYIMQDRTMVPMRAVFEALGAEVQWDEEAQTITVKTENDTIVLHIGSAIFYKNDQEKDTDVAPVILNERTMIPLRAISEALDATVNWNEETQTVVITMEDDRWKDNTGLINLSTMEVSGEGVAVEGNTIWITAGGDFEVSGVLEDGMIRVNTKDKVKLRLSGAHITNTTGSAIFFENTKKGFITLNADTENSLTDGSAYAVDAKATLFSNDDLEIKGSGSLKVYGNYKHGIASDDDIDIQNGNIEIDSVNDGIHANNTIRISGGTLSVNAERDGIQAEEDMDISGGTLKVNTTGEVEISAKSGESFQGGERFNKQQRNGQHPNIDSEPTGIQPPQINGQPPAASLPAAPVTSGKGLAETQQSQDSTVDEGISSKGIKAGTTLSVSGGVLNINSTDHAVHSAGQIQIKGGEFIIHSSAGKGISGHGNVTIDGGNVQIENASEGIESKAFLTINDGEIRLKATDDGLNAGGGGSFGQAFDRTQHQITINGGYLWIDAEGDGIDSNGDLTINGGTILVNGPVTNGNGALDSDSTILMNGGILVAAGSAAMAQAPGIGSIQNTVKITYDTVQPAGTLICITDQNQNPVVAFAPQKEYQSVIISAPALETGQTYTVYSGGTYQGTETDGFYLNGSYTAEGAAVVDQFVPESVITTVTKGSVQGNMGGGMHQVGSGRPDRQPQ